MPSMQITIRTELITRRPTGDYRAPWIKGRGPRRQLVDNFIIEVWTPEGRTQTICVPRGYIFDGASIPWFLWWAFPPGYDAAWEAAAVHDFIYSHLYHWHSKDFADRVFKAVMLEQGANPVIAQAFYLSVHHFGKGGW